MTLKLLLGLAMASLVSASTVTTVFMYDADPEPLVASIVGGDSTATTYSVNCAPGTDSSDCGLGPGLTLIAHPTATTYIIDSPLESFWWTVTCSVGGTTTAVCTETASGAGANFPGVSTVTLASGELPYMPMTVTAGSINAAAQGATATATATTTESKDKETTATPTATATGKVTSSSSSAVEKASSSAVSTGGMPQVTGDAAVVFGGAALALAIAAAL